MRPTIPCAFRNAPTARGVSWRGSTDTATICTCAAWAPMRSWAACRLAAITGHRVGQFAYRKVTSTALPWYAVRFTGWPR